MNKILDIWVKLLQQKLSSFVLDVYATGVPTKNKKLPEHALFPGFLLLTIVILIAY